MRKGIPQILRITVSVICIFCFSVNYFSQSFQVVSTKSTMCVGESAVLSITGSTSGKYSQLDISAFANFNWNTAVGGWTPAPQTGSPVYYNGIPFNLPSTGNNAWNAEFATGANPRIMSLTLDCPVKVDTIFTLINTYWGEQAAGTLAQIDFVFADNTTYTKNLDGNSDIRDYINNGWANNINNTTTVNVYSGIAAGRPSRLDMQQIALPAPFNNKSLSRIDVIDNGSSGVQRIVLNAITIALSDNDSVNWRLGSSTGTLIAYSDSLNVSPTTTTTYYAVNKYDNTCFDFFTLQVQPTVYDTIYQDICEGDVYIFNGNNYDSAGVYTDTLATVNGCDSIVTLSLAVNLPSYSAINQIICYGDTFYLGSTPYFSPGTYNDTLLNSNNCDSVITLNLSIYPSANIFVLDSICEGENYLFKGVYLNTTGFYADTLSTSLGCDSIVNLLLTVSTKPQAQILGDEEVCKQGSIVLTVSDSNLMAYNWSNGETTYNTQIREGGDYTVYITNSSGCKDTITKHIDEVHCVDSCELYIPNSFTPNKDGYNDSFSPVTTDGCTLYYYNLQIFNRWGKEIFSVFDVNEKWDGGKGADGIYVWKVTYKLNLDKPPVTKIGHVNLLR